MGSKPNTFKQLRYALKQVWQSDKLLLIFTLFKNSIEQIFYVFFFVYLTKYIFNCIEHGVEYRKLFWFLIIACTGHVVVHFICGWYETYRKIRTPLVYRHIFYKVMDISDTLTLSDYENPEFYDRYARALERSAESAMDLAITTGVYIGNVGATIMSLAVVVMVDPVLLVFMIIPMVVSLYFGKKNGICNFDREKAITRDKRTVNYVNRVYYEKKYAAEVRLFDINSILLDKQENAVEQMAKVSMKYRMRSAFYSFLMKGSYSILAGIAVFRCLKRLGAAPKIKWPNDIRLNGRKVCGILAETSLKDGAALYTVLGIGINVKKTAYSEEVAEIAISLEEVGIAASRESLMAAITGELMDLVAEWEKTGNISFIVGEYENSMEWINEICRVISADGSFIEGKVLGISSDGALRFLTEKGEQLITAGEVSLRR